MAALDYRATGETHGQALIALVEGLPAGISVDVDIINAELRRRHGGHGRGLVTRVWKLKSKPDTIDFASIWSRFSMRE